MSKEDQYCGHCGAELIGKVFNGFDTVTGEKKFLKVCPTGICGHYGVNHSWEYQKNFLRPDFKTCKKCGKFEIIDDGL